MNDKGVVIGLSAAASVAAFAALRLHPVTAIVSTIGLANQTLGEAYRVTIPFIAHISMLNMLYSPKIAQ